MQLGIAVDLFSVTLAEQGSTRLHALPNNKRFKHPRYGMIEFTPERNQRFADNVNKNVRGVALDIDYDHKQSSAHGTKAAGWVQGAEFNDRGLDLLVEFTDEAKEAIRKKEYRYFSPEFADTWTDPHSGAKYRDVVFGGGLTNRPFLRDHIAPVQLSDLEEITRSQHMGLFERIAALKGLTETSSDDDLRKAFSVETPPVGDPAPPAPPDAPEPPPDQPQSPQPQQFAEITARLAATERLLKENKVDRLLTETDGFALPVPARDKAKTFLMECGDDQYAKFSEFLTELGKTGMVRLGEQGRANPTGGQTTDDPVVEVERRIQVLMDANPGLAYNTAANEVAKDAALWTAYRNASFLSGEVK